MKKSKNKGLGEGIIIIIVIIIALVFLMMSITKDDKVGEDYSVKNTSELGYSVIFEALKELGLDVKLDYIPIEEMDTENCYVIVDHYEIYEEDLIEWADMGGTLIYISSNSENGGEIATVDYGEGKIIYVDDAEQLSNKWLVNDREAAYKLYTTLCEEAGSKRIIFNEYYMYYDELNPVEGEQEDTSVDNLWTILPLTVKIIVIQAILCVILFFFYAGKRFGKAQSLVSEEERGENEYIYSVAEIYKRAGAWDLALNSYYQALENKLGQLTRREGDLLKIWQEEKMPEENVAKQVTGAVKEMQQKMQGGKLRKQEVIPILEQIAYLMKIIDKRREQYWKL